MKPTGHRWTDAEIKRPLDLRDNWRMSWSRIAETMNMSVNAVQSKHQAIRNKGAVIRDNDGMTATRAAKPDPVIIARQRDYQDALERRTLTQALLGDPPPGYSALDRKRGAEGHT